MKKKLFKNVFSMSKFIGAPQHFLSAKSYRQENTLALQTPLALQTYFALKTLCRFKLYPQEIIFFQNEIFFN